MIKTIASIYFAEVYADRDIYGGQYRIPAVPKGAKPEMLIITDKVQRWQMAELFGRKEQRDLIASEEIARDLLGTWTTNSVGMTTDCHPGIWIVRDSVAILNEDGTPEVDAMGKQQFRTATEEEKAAMWDEDLKAAKTADANWAQYLIEMADAMAEEPAKRKFIPEVCKLAARHYGREREWLYALKDSDVKACPYCTSMVASAAVKCPKCSEIIDVAKYAELTRKKEAALKIAPPIPNPKPTEARA